MSVCGRGPSEEPKLPTGARQRNKGQRILAGSDASRGLMTLPDGLSPQHAAVLVSVLLR